MLKLPTVSAILALAITSSTVAAQATDADIARNADKYLTTRSEMGNFSGAVLIAKGDRVIFRKGYGFADLERRIPYTVNTKHAIASIAKMFTAMAALKLRDQGKLRLDDKVCTYVDDCPDAWRPVTIDQLIHHTSGIPDYEEALQLGSENYIEFMRKPDSHTRIISEMRAKPLDFTPGEKFKYSNTGYVLLAKALSRASGQPFADFVRKQILIPAGLKQTGALSTANRPANLAYGYTYGDIGWPKLLGGVAYSDGHMTRRPDLWFGTESGDGWLYSTLDDLHRWSRLMDGSSFVSPKLAAEVFAPKLDGYGFGWIVDSAFKRKRYHHTGSLPGYVSNLIKFPDDSVTIVIFANIDRGRMSSIVRDLTAITFGEPWDMPVRGNVVSLTPDQLSKLTGEYAMSDGTPFSVRVEDMLVAELKGRYTAGLIPLSPTEFYMPLGDGKAIFKLDSTGRAQEVNMRYAGLDRIARRVK
jgi:CubicO group peptidase (beta-lactamase class C family)